MGHVRSRGFSLIEVLVSIFIIGVILIMVQAVARSGVLVRTTKSQAIALSIARTELENIRGGGYTTLPTSGSFTNDLLSSLPAATAALTVSAYNEKTAQVTATVTWQDPGTQASSTVSLSTLITQTGGLP